MASFNAIYGESAQQRIVSMLDSYVKFVCSELENMEVRLFPDYELLYKNGVININEIVKQISYFEYDRAIYVGKISDLVIKKTQARLFLFRATKNLGEMMVKNFAREINFFLARMQDFEALLRVRTESADKAINSLRSIQSHSGKA